MSRRARNEGSVYERADGRWVGQIHVGYEGNKRRRKYVYGDTQREVVEKLTKVRREVQQGLPVANERLTVEQFLKDWLENTAKPSIRPNTYAGYDVNVRVHIIPAIGRLRLARLSPNDVERMLAAKTAADLSPRTVQYIRAVLRVALQRALSWGMVGRNVASLVKGPTVSRAKVTPLTPLQVRALFEGIKGDRLEGLYVAAFTLGMRQGELLGLRWEDLDLVAGTLRVSQTLVRKPGGRTFGAPKSERSNRTLALPGVTLAALKAHRARQLKERLHAGKRWKESGLVFTTRTGTACDSRNITKAFQGHLERLKLPRQRFHDARHACASLLLAQGVPLRTIMEILGHSQLSLTSDTYSHLSMAMQREAAESMDQLFVAQ